MNSEAFDGIFKQATGNLPYDYQRRLAEGRPESRVIQIPTGLGKTAAVGVSWVWRGLGQMPIGRDFVLEGAKNGAAPIPGRGSGLKRDSAFHSVHASTWLRRMRRDSKFYCRGGLCQKNEINYQFKFT